MNNERPTKHPSSAARAEAGFALITGLLLLIVMSLIGVTMLNVTRLETLMAGGAREANISLQAAEAALRDGEDVIERATGTAGFVAEGDVEPDFFDPATWTDANSSTITHTYPDIPDDDPDFQPRWIVKHMGEDFPEDIQVRGYQQGGGPDASVSIMRVTSRGLSRDGTASTILQSYYGKTY